MSDRSLSLSDHSSSGGSEDDDNESFDSKSTYNITEVQELAGILDDSENEVETENRKKMAEYRAPVKEFLDRESIRTYKDVEEKYGQRLVGNDDAVAVLMVEIIKYIVFYRPGKHSQGYTTIYQYAQGLILKVIKEIFPRELKGKRMSEISRYNSYVKFRNTLQKITAGMNNIVAARSMMRADMELLCQACSPTPSGYRSQIFIRVLFEIGLRGHSVYKETLQLIRCEIPDCNLIEYKIQYNDSKGSGNRNPRHEIDCSGELLEAIIKYEETKNNVTWRNYNQVLHFPDYISMKMAFDLIVVRAGFPEGFFTLHSPRRGCITEFIIDLILQGKSKERAILEARPKGKWSEEKTIKFYVDHNVIDRVIGLINKAKCENRHFSYDELTTLNFHPELLEIVNKDQLLEGPFRANREFGNYTLDNDAYTNLYWLFNYLATEDQSTLTGSVTEFVSKLPQTCSKHVQVTKVAEEVGMAMIDMNIFPQAWIEIIVKCAREHKGYKKSSAGTFMKYLLVNNLIQQSMICQQGLAYIKNIQLPPDLLCYLQLNVHKPKNNFKRIPIKVPLNDCPNFELNRIYNKRRKALTTDHVVLLYNQKVSLRLLTKKQCQFLDRRRKRLKQKGLRGDKASPIRFITNDPREYKKFEKLGTIKLPKPTQGPGYSSPSTTKQSCVSPTQRKREIKISTKSQKKPKTLENNTICLLDSDSSSDSNSKQSRVSTNRKQEGTVSTTFQRLWKMKVSPKSQNLPSSNDSNSRQSRVSTNQKQEGTVSTTFQRLCKRKVSTKSQSLPSSSDSNYKHSRVSTNRKQEGTVSTTFQRLWEKIGK